MYFELLSMLAFSEWHHYAFRESSLSMEISARFRGMAGGGVKSLNVAQSFGLR